MPDTRTNLGVVIPGFAGVYDPLKAYQFYEFVRDGNDTYISKKPCTGVPTSNSEYWFRVTDIGPVPTIQIGEVITLPPGSAASVTNTGNEKQAVLRFDLPGGTLGPAGEAATFSVVQTLTGAPETSATTVEAAGSTSQNRKYILTVPTGKQGPKGADGEAGTIAIGQVSTGLPNSDVKIENVGTSSHAILNITIPVGMPGHDGDGSGDMVRATYDANQNGIVDDAEKLGGRLPNEYAQAIHSHTEYLLNYGNGTSVTAAFTEAAAFDALSSGSTLGTLFGCVAKWVSALKNGTYATQANLSAHISNMEPHVSADDRNKWDDAALGIMTGTGGSVSLLSAPDYFAGIPLDLAIRLVSAQSGTGSPSPANIRPIDGKTQLTITHTGESSPESIYTVALPQALYGLSNAPDIVNIREGRITQNTGHLAFTGTETEFLWGFSSTQPSESTLARFLLPGLNLSINYKGICSHFPWIANPNPSTQKTECVGGYASDRTVYFYILKSRFSGWNDGWTNTQKVAALKAWLSTQCTEGTPVQIVYELVSPKTLTFQPQVIPALPGVNTLSVEDGDTVAALNLFEYLLRAGGGNGVSTEVDPTVPDWAKQPNKPSYIVEEIAGAVSETRTINAKALNTDITLTANDVGAAPANHTHAEYTIEETDPTVPAWAKQPQKPTYTYAEIASKPALAAVATTGNYNDLEGKPSIPSLPTLAPVATSGSYNDLISKPTIPTTPGEVQAYPAAYVQYSTTDLTSGSSPLATGSLYFVYE